nr:exodeoxyribonuclease V subunit alpha [Vallicoccus soli]
MSAAPAGPVRAAGVALEPLEDPYDVRRARGADAALRPYNEAGLLEAADVHVAQRLGELGGEPDPAVRLAVALAVRAVRGGSTCVALDEPPRLAPELPWPDPAAWVRAVGASPLVGPGRPLRWEDGLLYLERYHRQEVQVCDDLLRREAAAPPRVDLARLRDGLDRLLPERTSAQRAAAAVAATRWTTVLGGGPGTGKTTTVAVLLALLLDQPGPPPRVALAAPTGKAAARLQEALLEAADRLRLPAGDRSRLEGHTASTLHRLLGPRPGTSTRFRHDRDATLPYDVVVVDETSMVSLTLMARLLEALRPDTRLVLVGDPDQLASVEAGAVLADLVGGLRDRPAPDPDPAVAALVAGADAPDWPRGVVVLRTNHRYGAGIGALAEAVRRGDADAALAQLRSPSPDTVLVEDPLGDPGARGDVVAAGTALRRAALEGDAAGALALLGRHRLLCAHRTGPYGVDVWSRQVERWLAAQGAAPGGDEWYVGRPLLVTANDYALGLYNGDTGVVVRTADGEVRVAFARAGAADGLVRFAPSRLHEVQTVHAMTVHRSQGSQFDRVTLVLPEQDSPLLTRELLYTALTRAQSLVRVVAGEAALRAAVERPAVRASGLRGRLAAG